MSALSSPHPIPSRASWASSALVGALRARVDARLRDLPRGEGPASQAVVELLAAGGKRLRPVLVHLGGALVGADAGLLDSLAEAGELVHVASLLHDDLMDGAEERRGRPAAWRALGPKAAVLGGDRAHVMALEQAARAPGPILPRFLETVASMVEAQSLEIGQAGRLAGGEVAWRRVAYGKTAALCGWCAEAGALAAERPVEAQALRAFGEALGLAFQAVDDLIDLIPGMDPGKPAFADLRAGVPSLPLRYAAAADPTLRQAVGQLWRRRGEPTSALAEAVRRAGVGPTVGFVARTVAVAREALTTLPAGEPRAVLSSMAEDLAARAERCAASAVHPPESA
ncbi:MAG: polyprenyl synthetase family protein [Pseudomonadota bacterium]